MRYCTMNATPQVRAIKSLGWRAEKGGGCLERGVGGGPARSANWLSTLRVDEDGVGVLDHRIVL